MAEIKSTEQTATAEDSAVESTEQTATAEDSAVESTDELQQRAMNMNIKRHEPRDKPGVYDEQVDTLIQVDEQTGYQNEIEILVPTPDVLKHKRYFSQSAAKHGKTARIVNGDKGVQQAEGTLLAFVLTEKITRKPKVAPTADATPEKVA